MLRAQLYYQLPNDEDISQSCCGDSIQIRYMVLYTTLNRLIVISEDKFTRELYSSSLNWPLEDQIIALKYKSDQFKLHILTLNSHYCVLTLGLIFQQSFQEEWNKRQYQINMKNDFFIMELTPNIVVNKENYSNVVTLGESKDGYRNIKQIMYGIWDFQFWDVTTTEFYTIFMTQNGSALIFDFQKRNIPYIAEFKISILSFCIIQKPTEDYLLATTELNDIIRLQLSYKQNKKILITQKYEDERFQGQLHRFSNQRFQIAKIFLCDNCHKEKIILMLQDSQQTLAKYKASNLKSVKKVYDLNIISNKMQIMDIVDHAKVFVVIGFQVDHFSILLLSKKIMQEQSHSNNFIQKRYLFTQDFMSLQLVDEDQSEFQERLQNLFILNLMSDSELFQKNYEREKSIIGISAFIYQFQNKLEKSELRNNLLQIDQKKQNLQLFDQQNSVVNKSISGYRSVLFMSQCVYLLSIKAPKDYFPEMNQGFTGLQHYQNYLQTYRWNQLRSLNEIYFNNDLSWQYTLMILLWCKINYQEGLEFYLKEKNMIDDKIQKWVDNIHNRIAEPLQIKFVQMKFRQEQEYNQLDKCLISIVLLSLNNIPNDQLIQILLTLVFKNLNENSLISQDQINDIIKYNQESIIEIIQNMKNYYQKEMIDQTYQKQMLKYDYWKDMQQLLFVGLIILEVQLQSLIEMNQIEIEQASLNNKILSLIFCKDIDAFIRIHLIIVTSELQDQLQLFNMIIQQYQFKKEQLNQIILFSLVDVKILYKQYSSLTLSTIYYLSNLGLLQTDQYYFGNLINIWSTQLLQKKQKNLVRLKCKYGVQELVERQLRKVGQRYQLNQIGGIITMRLLDKLGLDRLSHKVYCLLSVQNQQQYEILKWMSS